MSTYTKYVASLKQYNKPPEPEDALAKIDQAAILISKAKTLDETFKLKAVLKVAMIEAQRKSIDSAKKEIVQLEFILLDKQGEIIEEMREKGELAKPGQTRGTKKVPLKTLEDLNMTKNQSSQAQKFHKLAPQKKAEVIEAEQERIGKKRKSPFIDVVPEDHVHNFNLCSCGLKYSLEGTAKRASELG